MAATEITLRDGAVGDLPRIFEIYNHEVEHGVATFDVTPRRVGVDDAWLTERAPYHPVIVAERRSRVAERRSRVAERRSRVAEGEDRSVLGWASTGPWSPRGAYRRTGEVSVYVDVEARGAGIGRSLLAALIDRARQSSEIRVLLARVALPNAPSLAVHESVGFRSFGIQRRCGEKLGRILDVNLMDLHLD